MLKITFAQGNSPLNIAESRLHIRHLLHDALTAVVYNVDIMSAFAEQHGFDFTKIQPRRLQQADGFHARQLRKIVFTVAVGQYARRLEQIDFIIKEQRPAFQLRRALQIPLLSRRLLPRLECFRHENIARPKNFLKGLDCNVTLYPILIVSPKSTLFNPKTEVFSGRTVRVRPGAPPKTVMKQKADKRGGVPCFFCIIR